MAREETVVIAAPMFHAWGYGQLLFAALMACTIVTRRKFDPEVTLKLIDRHTATGWSWCPPCSTESWNCRSRSEIATAAGRCGSPPRPDHVYALMWRSRSWTSAAT